MRFVPVVAVVSGVDTGIGAPIDIAVVYTVNVEDGRVDISRIWNVSPDASNINLGLFEETVPRPVVADFLASPTVLIVSAILPAVVRLEVFPLECLACLSLSRSALGTLSMTSFLGSQALSDCVPRWVASECFLSRSIPSVVRTLSIGAGPLAPVKVLVSFAVVVVPRPFVDIRSFLPLAGLASDI